MRKAQKKQAEDFVRLLADAHNKKKKYIGGISYKTLSATLKELEADGLVHREEYPQIPPKVEYSLTERGRSLMPILDQMCTWGETHRQDE